MTRVSVGHIATGQKRGARRVAPSQAGHCDAVWAFVCDAMRDSAGRPPTLRQIARGTGLPLRSVHQALNALERQQLIVRARFGQARGIGIVGARYVLPGEGGGEGLGMMEHSAAHRAAETQ